MAQARKNNNNVASRLRTFFFPNTKASKNVEKYNEQQQQIILQQEQIDLLVQQVMLLKTQQQQQQHLQEQQKQEVQTSHQLPSVEELDNKTEPRTKIEQACRNETTFGHGNNQNEELHLVNIHTHLKPSESNRNNLTDQQQFKPDFIEDIQEQIKKRMLTNPETSTTVNPTSTPTTTASNAPTTKPKPPVRPPPPKPQSLAQRQAPFLNSTSNKSHKISNPKNTTKVSAPLSQRKTNLSSPQTATNFSQKTTTSKPLNKTTEEKRGPLLSETWRCFYCEQINVWNEDKCTCCHLKTGELVRSIMQSDQSNDFLEYLNSSLFIGDYTTTPNNDSNSNISGINSSVPNRNNDSSSNIVKRNNVSHRRDNGNTNSRMFMDLINDGEEGFKIVGFSFDNASSKDAFNSSSQQLNASLSSSLLSSSLPSSSFKSTSTQYVPAQAKLAIPPPFNAKPTSSIDNKLKILTPSPGSTGSPSSATNVWKCMHCFYMNPQPPANSPLVCKKCLSWVCDECSSVNYKLSMTCTFCPLVAAKW